MNELTQWIYDYSGMSHSIQYKLLSTLILFVLIFSARRLVIRILHRNIEDIRSRYTWQKIISYSSYLIFIFAVSPIWISEFQTIGTFLGLLTAGLAIALKDPIGNLFAWVYIIIKKPFEIGDRVQIGTIEGDVADIGFFEFTLLEIKNWVKADQSTGRIVHVPNGLLFNQAVMNYHQGLDLIWHEIPIIITFESNWKKAKEVLVEIEQDKLLKYISDVELKLKKARKAYFVSYTVLDPTVYTQIKDQGVSLTMRYLCPPKKRRDLEQEVIEEILTRFSLHDDIELAYPTTRFYSATSG